jgi:hypothetical protein
MDLTSLDSEIIPTPFFALGEDPLDDPLLGVSLRTPPCLRVNIEREPAAGMPHQFLHNLHVIAVRDQKR